MPRIFASESLKQRLIPPMNFHHVKKTPIIKNKNIFSGLTMFNFLIQALPEVFYYSESRLQTIRINNSEMAKRKTI